MTVFYQGEASEEQESKMFETLEAYILSQIESGELNAGIKSVEATRDESGSMRSASTAGSSNIIIGIGALVALVAGFVGYKMYKKKSNSSDQLERSQYADSDIENKGMNGGGKTITPDSSQSDDEPVAVAVFTSDPQMSAAPAVVVAEETKGGFWSSESKRAPIYGQTAPVNITSSRNLSPDNDDGEEIEIVHARLY